MTKESEELAYSLGSRAAWAMMLNTCLMHLGIDDPAVGALKWVSEREAAVAALREVCRYHGDNDWPDSLHLADVIEKHLARHLNRK